MAEVKVRHALVFYRPDLSSQTEVTAFRGMKVNMPDQEAERLKGLYAVVDGDEELDWPSGSVLSSLPNTASDQELLAWASVASSKDIAKEMARHPDLKDRIANAVSQVESQIEAQNDLLSGLKERTQSAADAAQKEGDAKSAAAGDNPPPPNDPTEVARVITGSVAEVSAWLSQHPDRYDEVLQAETEHRAKENKGPRDGIVVAVRAAAAETAQ